MSAQQLKWQISCPKMWSIEQLYIELGFITWAIVGKDYQSNLKLCLNYCVLIIKFPPAQKTYFFQNSVFFFMITLCCKIRGTPNC